MLRRTFVLLSAIVLQTSYSACNTLNSISNPSSLALTFRFDDGPDSEECILQPDQTNDEIRWPLSPRSIPQGADLRQLKGIKISWTYAADAVSPASPSGNGSPDREVLLYSGTYTAPNGVVYNGILIINVKNPNAVLKLDDVEKGHAYGLASMQDRNGRISFQGWDHGELSSDF